MLNFATYLEYLQAVFEKFDPVLALNKEIFF